MKRTQDSFKLSFGRCVTGIGVFLALITGTANGTIMFFPNEAAFLNSANIVSTATFNEIPYLKKLGQGTVMIDGITYTADDPTSYWIGAMFGGLGTMNITNPFEFDLSDLVLDEQHDPNTVEEIELDLPEPRANPIRLEDIAALCRQELDLGLTVSSNEGFFHIEKKRRTVRRESPPHLGK